MDKVKNPDEAHSFGRLAVTFMKGIYEASDADFDKGSYGAIDNVISCKITSKIMAPDGAVKAVSIDLSSLGVAWWLSNYRWRDESKQLQEFQTLVDAHAP